MRRNTYRGFVPTEQETSHIALETSLSESQVPMSANTQAPLPTEPSIPEEKEKAKEEEEEIQNKRRSYSREEKKKDDDESDTDDDLNNSMEVPLEDDMLNFDGSDDVDLVLEYIQVPKNFSLSIIFYRIEKRL